ncbi:hypothetical protein DUI87_35467 [Hirundo rustica rustica]|uniref:Uncharacterized protein n=1 Tax=Hirundo rustica rustica TaxID=333673 RepID=A0A3M0IHE3_HIRRU|nr:hypothetical protein DUI87_35467 [Hirundo rustica rustica]
MVNIDMLMGTGNYTRAEGQPGYEPLVQEQCQQTGMAALVQTLQLATPQQPFATIVQGVDEPFLCFAGRLTAAVEKQFGKCDTEREGETRADTNVSASALANGDLLSRLAASTHGSAGVDVCTAESVVIDSDKIHKVPLDAFGPLGDGMSAFLIGRSSATIQGIMVHLGLIDADFLGQIHAMVSTPTPPLTIPKGTQIAQLVPYKSSVSRTEDRSRGDGGFGSTGPPQVRWTAVLNKDRPETLCTVSMVGAMPSEIRLHGLLDTGADVSILSLAAWPPQWPLSLAKTSIAGLGRMKQCYEQSDQGHLEPSTSPWSTPVFCIKKKSGKWRLLRDVRKINAMMEGMGTLQAGMSPPTMLPADWPVLIVDLKDWFFTIPLRPDDRPKFAFIVPTINNAEPAQRYQWKVLPQGVCNSPMLCQWYVACALSGVRKQFPDAHVYHYMDDILVATPTQDELLRLQPQLLNALHSHGLQVAPEKVQQQPPWKYLGVKILERTIHHQEVQFVQLVKTLNDAQKLVYRIEPSIDVTVFITTPDLHPTGIIGQWNGDWTDPLHVLEWVFCLISHREEFDWSYANNVSLQSALKGFSGQITYHLPSHKLLQVAKNTQFSLRPKNSQEPVQGSTIFTDGSGKTGKAIVTWQDGSEWQVLEGREDGSAQLVELRADVMAFEKFSQEPFNLITDSAYVADIAQRLSCSVLKEVSNPALFHLLKAPWCAIQARVHPYYILHVRSHTNLPGFVAEGNARADKLANPAWVAPQPDVLAQAKASHGFFHQNAHTLQKQFQLTATEAREIVQLCDDCHAFGAPLPAGVNPRGLKALELWQTDVTQVAEFGRLKYVHVTVDTFSSAMWASAHTGEKARDVIAHWRQAFAVLGIPSAVKTDSGPAYASQKASDVVYKGSRGGQRVRAIHHPFPQSTIRDLSKAHRDYGRDSPYFRGLLRSDLDATVVIPADLKQLFSCLLDSTEFKLWVVAWRQQLREALPSLLRDPETAVDDNGNPLTLEHLMGEERWADPSDQTSDIPIKALQIAREHAVSAFFGMVPDGPVVPYYKIMQGAKESFTKFVERLTRAIEVQVTEVAPILVTSSRHEPYRLQLTEAFHLRTADWTFLSINTKEQGAWPVQGKELVIIGDSAGQAIIYHYMDDVLVCAPNDEMLSHVLGLTVDALVAAGFELQEEKVQRMPPWKYLGLEIGKRTIVPQKLSIKTKFPPPTHSPTINHLVASLEDRREEEELDQEEVLEGAPDDEERRNPDEEEHGLGHLTQHH